ncbi:hypothetical protein MCETHM1_01661 [Flavobacteriaceae bacterium]
MKKIAFLFLFAVSFGYSQTSIDEYNYMTKGYGVTISSGLDIKKGYQIKDLTTYNTASYTFDYKLLIREADNSLAGVILRATSKIWSNVYYLAIPVDNQELLKPYYKQLELWDEPMITAYSESSTFLNSELIKFFHSSKK